MVKWYGSEDPYRAVGAITRYLRGLLAAPRG